MSIFSFSIGGVEITESDAHDLSVELTPVEGSATLRTQSGALIKQTAWTKYAVKISSEGNYLPPALQGLDCSASMEFLSPQGITERKAVAASITTNRDFRTDGDYVPEVYALLADGSKSVRTSAIAGVNTLDVTLTGGEQALIVLYFPKLVMYFSPPSQTWEQYDARSGWTITGEEA
jgi:hypothetical protein